MQRGIIQLSPPALQLLNEQATQLNQDFTLLKQKLASASAQLSTPWGIQSPTAGTSFQTDLTTPKPLSPSPIPPAPQPSASSPTATHPTTAETPASPSEAPADTIGLEISAEDAEALLDTLPAPEPEEQSRLTQARKSLQTFLLLLRQ